MKPEPNKQEASVNEEIPSSPFQTQALRRGQALFGELATFFHALLMRNEELETIVRFLALCDPHYYRKEEQTMTCFFCGHTHEEEWTLEIQRTAHYKGCKWMEALALIDAIREEEA